MVSSLINRPFGVLLAFCFSIVTTLSFAQVTGASVGKIIYLEGKVEVSNDDAWTPVKMNHQLLATQSIRTPGNGMAEIQWTSGTKTVVGPNSVLNVGELAKGQSADKKTAATGSLTSFKRMFNESTASVRKEEGGIRRNKAVMDETASSDGIYWKQEREISFEEAAEFYTSEDYTRAISAFHAFLQQKPEHEKVPMAWVALAHAYLEVNNAPKARQLLEAFLDQYPEHALSGDVRTTLAQL